MLQSRSKLGGRRRVEHVWTLEESRGRSRKVKNRRRAWRTSERHLTLNGQGRAQAGLVSVVQLASCAAAVPDDGRDHSASGGGTGATAEIPLDKRVRTREG
ncbi:hypothetical protein AAHA92_05863 [Salvia divinorum]|uniref:Uncharacterized protein n=1 Tax=Salvia divinorum TaxID=28513 RepID=A0ABD1I3W1_SALDI